MPERPRETRAVERAAEHPQLAVPGRGRHLDRARAVPRPDGTRIRPDERPAHGEQERVPAGQELGRLRRLLGDQQGERPHEPREARQAGERDQQQVAVQACGDLAALAGGVEEGDLAPVERLPVGAGGDVGGARVRIFGQLLPGHQPHPARVVAEHPAEEREHLGQPVGHVEEARHVGEQPLVAAVHAVAHHRVEERRLALEVLVDRADVHACPLGDRVDARPGEALRRELGHRPAEHHLARAGGVAAPRLGAVGARRVGRRHAADTNMRNTCFQYSLQR
ncbi:MAG TPA: hypothetical protein VLL30_18865 [Reyranella sp.]|nr:hypothetical protein [Reyranella sp.]